MRFLRSLTVLVVAVAFGAGCSDSTDPEEDLADLTVADLAGTWTATSLLYSASSGGQSLDLVTGGGSVTMTIQSSGVFSGRTVYPPYELDVTYTGVFRLGDTVCPVLQECGRQLMQDFDDDGPTLTWTLSAYTDNSMTWTGGEGPCPWGNENCSITSTVNR